MPWRRPLRLCAVAHPHAFLGVRDPQILAQTEAGKSLAVLVAQIDVDLTAPTVTAPVFQIMRCLDFPFLRHVAFCTFRYSNSISAKFPISAVHIQHSRLSAFLTQGEMNIVLPCQPISTAPVPALIHFSPSSY